MYMYVRLQVHLVPSPCDSKCMTVSVSVAVFVSVFVSVSSSLADYQWYLVSNTQYVVSLEKSTGNHRRPVNPKQPRETQATRQAVNPE